MYTKQATTSTRSTQVEIPISCRPVGESRVTMFYDGGCSLCGREVAHYRRLDKADRVQWIDINPDPGVLDAVGIRYEEAMARLHVRDRAGEIQTGAWAFAAVWDELPFYRWLSRVVRALYLLPAMEAAYTLFARWRLKRRGCKSGSCKSP